MANTLDTAEALFYVGKMNKDLDERFIKPGEYVDALNIRIGSSELGASNNSDLGSSGSIENSKGNTLLTNIQHVSSDAKCIGAYEDSANETIYWFVTSTNADLVLSYNANTSATSYHLVSLSSNPILNFNSKYLINGINKIDDLLFWTDNLNPPRRINVTSKYTSFDESDISVIVAPPMSSPLVSIYNSAGEENYIIDKFISFAYRYKYDNGEYSALSQFSDIAFEPDDFYMDYGSFSNASMTNLFNSLLIKFNTGPKQVVGIDICFKTSNSNIINVIEKFNKKKEGWSNNDPNKSLVFTNKKIYTTLQESELLRLYDNVPRLAKAQTSIGNRIVYGNYVDGYNVGDVDYSLKVINKTIDSNPLTVTYANGIGYTIDPIETKNIGNSKINIDFTDIQLKKGFVFKIDFNLTYDSYSGDSGFNNIPDSPGPGYINNFSYRFYFLLEKDYDSIWHLASSQEFIDAVSTHKPYYQASEGNSLTDIFNNDIVSKEPDGQYGEWKDISSSPFLISAELGSNILGIQCPAVKFSTEYPEGTLLYAYQYFRNSITRAYFSELGGKRSLHSNRDYEVAVVYMDEYLRSSTALVDTLNTVFIDPEFSSTSNRISVTLKSLPPVWATKYKFVLKQSTSNYETIYTNLSFQDSSNNIWFKLEGENRQKVIENQKLIVKADKNGVVSNLVEATVLELTTQNEGFISGNENSSNEPIVEPSGLYMKLRPSGFSAGYDPDSFKWNGSITEEGYARYYFDELNPEYVDGSVETTSNRKYRPFAIPEGTQITFKVSIYRRKRGRDCSSYSYDFKQSFTSAENYNNMFDWFMAEGPDLNNGKQGGEEGAIEPPATVSTTFKDYNINMGPLYGEFVNNFFFQSENAAEGSNSIDKYGKDYEQGRLRFVGTSGYPHCGSTRSRVTLDITVQLSSGVLVFETNPEQSNDEIYFENSQSFDIVDGYHMSGNKANDQNQTGTQDAIIDLDFFNCFSFGNGVESYKIKDSLTGASLYLGSRVTAVSQEEFKESHRYAGITYSGVYNAETNLNKLNEFNLSLANWKDCEKSFGPINVLHGRQTDMLVLQEDKISNVLVGKNLLSDAAGGGAITSIPEVLGTQVARIEEYGISDNPESFVVYGYDSYFTDTKRNVVLNLKGNDLIPISNTGMSSWFRSEFKDRVGFNNIAGYDPYMKEYVLSLSPASKYIDLCYSETSFDYACFACRATPISLCYSDISSDYACLSCNATLISLCYNDVSAYNACSYCNDTPTLTTAAISSLSNSSATSGGSISSDGGSVIITKGVCWNTTGNPDIDDNKIEGGEGTGSFSVNITGLSPGIQYHVRAYATNNAGTAYGNEVSFTTLFEIAIGDQTWTTKNLDVTTYRNGDEIPEIKDGATWRDATYGAWCYYNNDTANGSIYGKLYNWYAVNDTRGLAPLGYHVPSNTEWVTLTNELNGASVAGGKMKATGTTLWNYPNDGATNSSGFTGLPGGIRSGASSVPGFFSSIKSRGGFWSTSVFSAPADYLVRNYTLKDTDGTISPDGLYKNWGISVRLIKD